MNPGPVSWHKLAVSLLGIAIIVGIWQWATWHLYSLPAASITAFTSITTNCFYTIAMLVFFFVTGKVLVDWKNISTTAASQLGQVVDEHRTEQITEKIFNCEKLDPKDLDAEAFDQ